MYKLYVYCFMFHPFCKNRVSLCSLIHWHECAIVACTSGSRGVGVLKLVEYRSPKRQNALFRFYRFQNIHCRSYHSGRMHHLPSLFSKCSRYFQNIVSNSVIMRQSTSLFSKVPGLRAAYFTHPWWSQNMCCLSHCSFKYRFKKCHNTCESVLVSKWSLQFRIVSNTVIMQHLSSLLSTFLCSSLYCFKCRQGAPFSIIV